MEIMIKQATKKDMVLIGEFIRRAYGIGQKGTSQLKYPGRWQWLYIDNPFISEADEKLPIWLAIKDNAIIGQTCGIPVEINIKDRVYNLGWAVDLIVIPEFRGEGIGRKLMEEYYRHFQVGSAISMANSTRRIWHKLGNVPLKPMNIYLYPIKINKALVRYVIGDRLLFLQGLFANVMNGALLIKRTFNFKLKRYLNKSIVEASKYGEDFDALCDRTQGDYKAIVIRDSKYLTWRFSSNRQFEYRTFVLKNQEIVKGYIVVRKPHQKEVNIGHIVDFYAAKNDIDTVDDLILYAIRFFGKSVDAIKCFSSVVKIEELMKRYGFMKIEKMNPLVLTPDNEIRSRIASVSGDWFLTLADHDLDQVGFNLDKDRSF